MNCMIQCLYHNLGFRNGVFSLANFLSTTIKSEENAPIYELQRIFAHLLHSKAKAYDPAPFAKALKIEATAVQQDAQEFLKLLITYMESKLSTIPGLPPTLRTLVQDHFRGTYAYKTTCCECKRTSSMEVSFYDLDLKVQGFSRLEECLADFFKTEHLQGDNRYRCDTCSQLRDAERGIKLLQLPKVLNLQLMRFVYDVKSGSRKKVSQQISFPRVLDLSAYMVGASSEAPSGGGGGAGAPLPDASQPKKRQRRGGGEAGEGGGAADAERGSNQRIYDLQALVLHSGPRASEGHYVAQVKISDREVAPPCYWRFDDDRVVSLKDDEFFGTDEAVERGLKKRQQAGGGDKENLDGRVRSKEAYMLIYTRRDVGLEEEPMKGAEESAFRLFADEIESVNRQLDGSCEAEKTVFETDMARRREAEQRKESIFHALPCAEGVGMMMRFDLLKHWGRAA